MNSNKANRSIECMVAQCANHCGSSNYCLSFVKRS